MIMIDNKVVPTLVIIAKVVSSVLRGGRLLFASCADIVYRRVVENFLAFVLGQVLHLTALQDGW
jgi:hypothetical protein